MCTILMSGNGTFFITKKGEKKNLTKNAKQKRKRNERGKRIDPEVCQVDTNDGIDQRIDPEIFQINRQIINLPRMAGARRRHPISPPLQWKRIYPVGPFRPKDIPFTGEEKIIPSMPRNPTSLDFFQLNITDEIIDRIVTETNLYAEQFVEK